MPSLSPLNLAAEFPILGRLNFQNHAGVAPISHRAAESLRQFATQAETLAYHHARWYARANEVKKLVARFIGAAGGEEEIAFTSNTSGGLSLVAKGLDWKPGDQVIITNVEYPANRYPWEDLKRFGVELVEVQQTPQGRIEVGDVIRAITSRTRIVALSHVQYASGFRIDLKPISDAIHRVGGYLCVDAIQSVGAMPVNVVEMGIDFLSADGHKWMLGPEGCGIFYCRKDLIPTLHPNVVGWMNMVDATNYGNNKYLFQNDARRFEPGSYNIPGILALGASLELLTHIGQAEIWSRLEALTSRLCAGLQTKGYRVFSPRGDGERSGIVVFEPPATPHGDAGLLDRIVSNLESRNIIIVTRGGRLRASPHFYNTPHQMDELVAALPEQ